MANGRASKLRWYTRSKGESTSVCLIRQVRGHTNLVFAAVIPKKIKRLKVPLSAARRCIAESTKASSTSAACNNKEQALVKL